MVGRKFLKQSVLALAALAGFSLPSAALAATAAFTLTTPATATFPATTVGSSSVSQSLVLTATRTVTISSIAIATATGSRAEFVTGTTAGCASLASGGTCTIPVTFKPFFAGVRQATLTVTDSTGTVYSVGLSGIANGPQGLLGPGTVNYNGTTSGSSFAGDGGALSTARFGLVANTTVDASGNWYIADSTTHNIRVVYQSGAALACLIQIEEPTLFGLTAGTTSCVGATSAPVAGNIYTIAGDARAYSTTVTAHLSGADDAVLATANTTTTSTLLTPYGVAVDAAGNVIIADYGNYNIRVVYSGGDAMACLIEVENPTLFGLTATATSCAGATSNPTPGFIYTLGGKAVTPGITGDGGKATSALMANVIAVAVSSAGDVFLTDNSTQSARTARIRVIYNGGAQAAALIALESPGTTPVLGNIYKLVGGTFASTGDGALASSGGLLYSRGIVVDGDGDVVFTDYSTTSGSTEAKVRVVYNGGTRMAALITKENPSVTAPTPGFLYTLAGNAGTIASPTTGLNALASSSVFAEPWGVTMDPAGNIYFADYLNLQVMRIGVSDGLITNYIGQGYVASKSLTNGNALTKASIWIPWGVAFGADGTIYFTDYGVYHVRTDTAQAAAITFATSAPIGAYSETQLVYHTNVGNTPLTIASITPDTNFAQVASGQSVYADCAAGTVLAAGQTCAIGVALYPTVSNTTLTGVLTVKDNSSVGTYTVSLTGVSAVQTVTTIASSNLNLAAGSSVTFTANVSVAAGQTVPSTSPALAGTVTFKDGTATIGTAQTIDVNGNASVSTATLTGGSHTITATFAPATADYSSSSAKLTEVVTALATTTTVTSSNPNADQGASVTLTATVTVTSGQTIPSGTPALAGTVTITDTTAGTALVTAGTLSSSNTVTYTTTAFTVGSHVITAVFTPAAINYASSTGTFTQVVSAPAYSVSITNTGVAVQTGNSVAVPFSLVSVGGYKGTVTGSCSQLPSNLSCGFVPSSTTFSGADNTAVVNVYIRAFATTTNNSHTARNVTEIAGLLGAAMLLFFPRRRRLGVVLMAIFTLALSTGLTGCSNGVSVPTRGTFNINVTFTDGTTPLTTPITVSVIGNPGS